LEQLVGLSAFKVLAEVWKVLAEVWKVIIAKRRIKECHTCSVRLAHNLWIATDYVHDTDTKSTYLML